MSSQYIQELKRAINANDAAFGCSGSIGLDGPLTLLAKVPAAEDRPASLVSLEFPIVEPSETSLQPLLDVCVPAAFGRGQASVLDPAYRQALVLPSNVVTLHAPGFNLASILDVVGDTLVDFAPNEDKAVAASFDKLNVYGPGGFFRAHADTPRSKEMFASLVLALPCTHTGGELVLQDMTAPSKNVSKRDDQKGDGSTGNTIVKGDGARVFSWGASKNISWVAFRSDRIHEVLPVIQGYRITLTYNLFVEQRRRIHLQRTPTDDQTSASQELTAVHQPTVKHPIFDALAHFVSSPDCYPEGVEIGIHLVDRYVFGLEDTADSVLHNLRGSDFFLYRALVALNLRFTVHFVLYVENRDSEGEDVILDAGSTCEGLSSDDFEEDYITRLTSSGDGELLSETGIQVINYWKRNTTFFHGTYGNEPSIDYSYGSVMFRIEIPAAKNRKHV